jgi:hypothetical protein
MNIHIHVIYQAKYLNMFSEIFVDEIYIKKQEHVLVLRDLFFTQPYDLPRLSALNSASGGRRASVVRG